MPATDSNMTASCFQPVAGTIPTVTTADRSTPPGRRPALERAAVVDVAESLLDDGGFERLSVRHLAERLGVSRQVVYTHFGGVDGLLDALHERGSAYLSEALAATGDDADRTDHIVAATLAYLEVARRHPHLYRLVFEQPVPDYVPSSAARRVGRTSFGHVVVATDAWLRGVATAVPDDPSTWDPAAVDLARATWTSAHGFAVLERVGYADRAETDRLVVTAVRAMLDGWPVRR